MTPKQKEAIRILKLHGPLSAGQFARFMWPAAARRSGSYRGAAQKAGAWLWEMRRQGLVVQSLTHSGVFVWRVVGEEVE